MGLSYQLELSRVRRAMRSLEQRSERQNYKDPLGNRKVDLQLQVNRIFKNVMLRKQDTQNTQNT